jgi:hypothetical protein
MSLLHLELTGPDRQQSRSLLHLELTGLRLTQSSKCRSLFHLELTGLRLTQSGHAIRCATPEAPPL